MISLNYLTNKNYTKHAHLRYPTKLKDKTDKTWINKDKTWKKPRTNLEPVNGILKIAKD